MNIDVQWANFWVGVVSTAITLLAVLVALFGQKCWEWFNRPKVFVGISDKSPHVVINVTGNGSEIVKYIRLRIKNEGNTILKNCHIRLISVVSESKKDKPSEVEPDRLDWSSAPLDMDYRVKDNRISEPFKLPPISREKIDISPSGGWELCDLLQMTSFDTTKFTFLSSGRRYIKPYPFN